jgi:zinc finger homeobox protein 1/2
MQRILELTGANHLNNPPRTPSTPMKSDPEDMIEEVNEDASEERKLVMDLKDEEDDDDDKQDIRVDSPRPETPVQTSHAEDNHHESYSPSPIKHEPEVHVDVYRVSTPTEIKEEAREEEKLQCGQCKETFNHPTELVQHEKVLCGSLLFRNKMADVMALNMAANSYMHQASGSEDDNEDRESKVSNESERKVRVRTAISEEQQTILKEYYASNARPNREEFRVIAQRLMLDPRVVQVWFQNNRSRERKLGNATGKPLFFNPTNSSASESPASFTSAIETDQPLDLSVKRERSPSAHSPRYGTVPQQFDSPSASADEAMNLSIKSELGSANAFKSFYPYPLPGDFMRHQTPSPNEAAHPQRQSRNPYGLGLVSMDRLFKFAPEMARNPLINRGNSLSPGSEKRSWRDDDPRYDGSFLTMPSKRPLYTTTAKEQPDAEGQYVCDQCDKAFSKHSSLARHKYEHSGELMKER